tara:strand:- start:152 stop:430 length:279 start_codon:yes stop_codon:yes gene_type:complete
MKKYKKYKKNKKNKEEFDSKKMEKLIHFFKNVKLYKYGIELIEEDYFYLFDKYLESEQEVIDLFKSKIKEKIFKIELLKFLKKDLLIFFTSR